MTALLKKRGSVRLPASVFTSTIRRLALAGSENRESAAYWIGTRGGPEKTVESVVFADDYPDFQSGMFFAKSPMRTAFLIGKEIHHRGGALIAQIHTHPSEAFHSDTDNLHPISHRPGFLSVVVPSFGRDVRSIQDCRTYVYHGTGRWSEVSSDAEFSMSGD